MRAILLAMCAAAAGAATSPAARSGHGEVEGPAPVRISRQGMVQAEDAALRERAAKALRKAVEFYRTSVAAEGGYHFADAEDLSYDRSEMSEGPTCVEVQRDSTPLVGMAYLEAFEATADSYYLEAAREVARALVKGQYCSGGWDYFIEFEPQSVRSTRTALTGVVASADPSAQSGRQRWMTTSRRPACVS